MYFNNVQLLRLSGFICGLSANVKGVLLADGADEAGGVVGLAQGSDHFPLHKVPTAIAAGAVHALVVQRAQIVSILHEEAPLGEVTAAHCIRDTHTHTHIGTLRVRSFSALPI